MWARPSCESNILDACLMAWLYEWHLWKGCGGSCDVVICAACPVKSTITQMVKENCVECPHWPGDGSGEEFAASSWETNSNEKYSVQNLGRAVRFGWEHNLMFRDHLSRHSYILISLVTQLCLTLQSHGLKHARLPCPSPTPRTCSNSCPLSRWCHPVISSSVVPFSSCLQSFPASGSFPMSRLFASGGQSIGASALAIVLPMSI